MQMADNQRIVLHFGSANPLNATMLQKILIFIADKNN